MGMNVNKLDRRLQFRRYTETQGPFGTVEEWTDHGLQVWAHRSDIKDSEKIQAGQVLATLTSRFTVRSSEFTRDINPTDRLQHAGLEWNITGIKESADGRLQFLELTASARADA